MAKPYCWRWLRSLAGARRCAEAVVMSLWLRKAEGERDVRGSTRADAARCSRSTSTRGTSLLSGRCAYAARLAHARSPARLVPAVPPLAASRPTVQSADASTTAALRREEPDVWEKRTSAGSVAVLLRLSRYAGRLNVRTFSPSLPSQNSDRASINSRRRASASLLR